MSKSTVTDKKIAKNYAKLAENYDKRWSHFNAATHDWVINHMDTPPQSVLDLGCGTGTLLKRIHDKYPDAKLTGLDGTPEMLDIARTKVPQTTFQETDLNKIKTEGQFDIVLSVNVLHHLQDPQAHIGSLQQLCAANGTVFLCDFVIHTLSLKLMERYWRQFHPAHHKAFSKGRLKEMLSGSFTIKDEAVLKPDWFWRLQIYKLRKA